jgi:hypothetical protein
MLDRLFPSDSAKMLVALKRATVNRPPNAGAISGLQGGELQPHHFHDHGTRPIVASFVV